MTASPSRRWPLALGLLAILAGLPTAARADDPPAAGSVVLLDAAEPTSGPKADLGLLLREIVRQAVLIAARDELNLSTRDAVLGEFSPDAQKLPRLDIRTRVVVGEVYEITIISAGEKPRPVWSKSIKLPDEKPIDYLAIVTEAEKLSRTELPTALERAGYKKRPAPDRPRDPAQKRVDALLEPLTHVGQFAAARELHGPSGPADPAERSGGLARAYADLGQLTAFQWGAAHKAFQARGLLYAERFVAAQPKSPAAHWHRAYARALAGLPAAALDSLAEAGRLRDALPEADRPAPPGWVKLIEAYCRRDYVRLAAAARPGLPDVPLAQFLWFLTLEEHGRGATFIQQGLKAVAASPDCFRYYDGLYQSGQLGVMQGVAELGPDALRTHFPQKVAELPQLPSSVRDLAAGPEATPERLAGVTKGLAEAGRPGKDAGEPSWAALGAMAREVAFAQAVRDMDRHKRALGLGADECKECARAYLPLLTDHPYRDYVAALAVDERRQPDVQKALLRGIPLRDAGPANLPLVNQLRRYDGKDGSPGAAAARLVTAHGDETADDLLARLRGVSTAGKPAVARRLLKVSPHTAAAAVALIETDWEAVADKAGEWEKTYADAPDVQAALGKKYTELTRYADAERCLKANVRLSGDYGGYRALADLYKAQGDMARWRETLDDYLKTENLGLNHARVQVDIARYLLGQGKAEEAKPYADQAAETWAGWAMLCACDVHEKLGEWAEAEQWVKNTSERYDGSRHRWLFWCVRTGRGDAAAARKLVLDRAEKMRGSGDLTVATAGLTARLTGGDAAAAYRELKAYLKANPSTRILDMHVALLAHELGEAKERDEWLDLVIRRSSPPAKKGAPPKPAAPPRPPPTPDQAKANTAFAAAGELAKLLRLATASKPAGPLDGPRVDEILNTVDPDYRTEIQYLAARYCELAGRPDDARRYYQASATTGGTNRMATVLSAYRLRELDKKPGK